MEGKLLDNVNKHVQGFMKGTMKQLESMQSAPVGMQKRSPQEKRKIWDSIMAIEDKDMRNGIMTEMATMAGHKGSDFDSCDWCKFVRANVVKQ